MSERLLHINEIGGCVGISQPEGMPDKIGIRLTLPLELFTITNEAVQDAIAAAVASEREACAKIAEDEDSTIYDVIGHPEEYPRYIGLAIRARGKE